MITNRLVPQPDFLMSFGAALLYTGRLFLFLQSQCKFRRGGARAGERGVEGLQPAAPRQASLYGAKHQQELDWQGNLPALQIDAGGSGYVIPLLDCESSKHKAQIASCRSRRQ